MDGLLRVDKPAGWTSHDVVQFFRGRLGSGARVGHTGTLDPIATGLLILLVGRATRSQAELQKLPKVYGGRVRLGLKTETGDLDSKQRIERPVPELTLEDVRGWLGRWVGEVSLPAPAYSAVKYKGRPLYAYARKGVEVPRGERKTTVRSWEALSYEPPLIEFRLDCSSGTYVRALAEALGDALGCGAVVETLRRLSIGTHDLAGALTVDEARALSTEALRARLTPLK